MLCHFAKLATRLGLDLGENKQPKGVGTLRDVKLSKVLPADRCFLTIEHEHSHVYGVFADR